MDNLQYLVDGKYSFEELVDIDRLQVTLQHFSEATGFTTGLLSFPEQKLLIRTGWRDICTKFHRICPDSEVHCKHSNIMLTSQLRERKEMNINHCENGLVDGASPVIIEGVHIANLFSGQIFFQKPDVESFRQQGLKYGYDIEPYLKALEQVPVVTEEAFKKVLLFLSDMAVVLGELGLKELRTRQAKKQLQQSEEHMRITLNSIGDAVIATDIDGIVKGINPVAQRLTGWPECEAIGKPLKDVLEVIDFYDRHSLADPVCKVLDSGKIEGLNNNALLINRFGQEYHIADSGAPILASNGEVIGVVLVFRDISEEYALQEKLYQSQKLESIGQLAGGIAHDFNNMLGGIIGGTELVQSCIDSGNDPQKYLKIILQSAERAAELTSKLLTFARKQHVASSVINVISPLREALSLLTSTADKRIVVQAMLPDEEIPIVGDPAQLQSAFLNLLINATHAMPEGGTIFVTAQKQELDVNYCNARGRDVNPGQFVEIEIRDTGCGIAQETMVHIFEPFYTTKEHGKGTGLGLSVVHGTVTQHKGFVTVYSEVGSGTSFHVFLPLADSRVMVATDTLDTPVRGSGTILLVDDESVMLLTASSILRDLGYEVLVAENGIEALECFERNMERIDLVILDMVMPQMNGRDCFWAMKKMRPDIRVILSSGFSRDEDVAPMKQAGLKGFIHKPYRIAPLSKAVREALGEDDSA